MDEHGNVPDGTNTAGSGEKAGKIIYHFHTF
jgi:hypothetical protein